MDPVAVIGDDVRPGLSRGEYLIGYVKHGDNSGDISDEAAHVELKSQDGGVIGVSTTAHRVVVIHHIRAHKITGQNQLEGVSL